MICPDCDYAAAYHHDAGRTLVSLFGPLRYLRAYYYCRRCGQGQYPFDARAGLPEHQLTPAVERPASLAGGVSPSFEKGAELLEEMSGVDLSESTVERTTEDVGARIAVLLNAGVTFGPRTVWSWRRDARGRIVAYVSIDATGTRQQGPGGRRAEGRMAYVGGIFNPPALEERAQAVPNGRRAALQARYLSGLYTLEEMGPRMRQTAARVGMEQAEVWIALTDGGAGLEAFMQKNFNRADLVPILDFYHAASYLEKLAKALHPQDETASQSQAEQLVQPAQSGRGGVDAGSAAAVGLAGAEVGGVARAVGNGADVLRQQRASHGLSGVSRRGLAHRRRRRGKRL